MPNNSEITFLRFLMESFIEARLNAKLEKEKDEAKRQKLKQVYEPGTWLADAARRVSQIQLVSHAVKFLNPNAKGSSIYLADDHDFAEEKGIVSTKSLYARKDDVVGNAAALDVFKFLELADSSGKTILSRVLTNDSALRAALPGSDQQKTEWLTAFASITQSNQAASTHTLAKQVYFPVEQNHYHILAPLYPTSLAHALYEQVQTRFSEETKAARQARKNNAASLQGYREYVNLAVQTAGGSKPQNISQLNSVRGGKIYLLPSLPPEWKTINLQPPLKSKTVWRIFRYQVRNLIRELRRFLRAVKNKGNNIDIRDRRADLIQKICDRLLDLAAAIQSLPPGWSADPACRLPEPQKFWLDPFRAEQEPAWAEEREKSDWRSEVSSEFGLWLNSQLEMKELKFGEDEHHEWKKLLKRELSLLREAI